MKKVYFQLVHIDNSKRSCTMDQRNDGLVSSRTIYWSIIASRLIDVCDR